MKIKKYQLVLFLSCLHLINCFGQATPQEIANRKHKLLLAKSDTAKVTVLLTISNGYRFSDIDSALFYNDQALSLSRKAGWRHGEAFALSNQGSICLESGDIPNALKYMLEALNIADKIPDPYSRINSEANIENRIGNIYMEIGEYKTSIFHYHTSLALGRKVNSGIIYNEISNIGNDYEMMGRLDSAKFYFQKVNDGGFADTTTRKGIVWAELRQRWGNLESDLGHYDTALMHYRAGIHDAIAHNDLRNLSVLYLKMAGLFKTLKVADSSFLYAKKTLATGRLVSMKKSIYEADVLLSSLFELKHQPDSALIYARLSAAAKDGLYGPKTFKQLQLLTLREQQRQQQLEEDQKRLQYNYLVAFLAFVVAVFLLIALILWRNNRKQKITNRQLNTQKEEILAQRNDLDEAFTRLKQTQNQLIQSEKMASLGELTAGIAHEIQNPLNFVNNFSEVSVELLDEMDEELDKGDIQEAKTIGADLKQNLQKIQHHGKRADFIVKGMLEHSRAGTGEKQLTDMNVLCDEFMKLSYHGLRAKDKSFNAEMVTHFDPKLPKVNVSQQDMGRVMLNLFNNAFYAVNQKLKTAGAGYKPEVTVTTFAPPSGGWGVKVKDNGVGIPDAIKEKIMQPFFTTKPTGEGTGLGLSITYDMVVKGHGGTIEVNTKEGEFTQFVVLLPLN